jgi:hypothetical protein
MLRESRRANANLVGGKRKSLTSSIVQSEDAKRKNLSHLPEEPLKKKARDLKVPEMIEILINAYPHDQEAIVKSRQNTYPKVYDPNYQTLTERIILHLKSLE